MRLVVARLQHPDVARGDRRHAQSPCLGQARAQPRAFGGKPAHAQPHAARARALAVRSYEPAPDLVRRAHRCWHAGRKERGGECWRLDDDVQPGRVRGDRVHELEVVAQVARGEHRAQTRPTAPVERDQQRTRPQRRARCPFTPEPAGVRQRARGVGQRRDLGPEHGRDAAAARRVQEPHRQVEVVAVGQTERAVAQFGRARAQRLGRGDARQQRAMRPHPQGCEQTTRSCGDA